MDLISASSLKATDYVKVDIPKDPDDGKLCQVVYRNSAVVLCIGANHTKFNSNKANGRYRVFNYNEIETA